MRAFARLIVCVTFAVLAAPAVSPVLAQTAPASAPVTLPATRPAALIGPALPATMPVTQPATQAVAVAASQPTAEIHIPASTRPTTRISLNFKDAAIDAVLEHLSEVAGFVVVKESPVDGRVTVLSKQPITPDEAVTLLNTVLKVNGFTAIQMGRILKIVSRDKAKRGSIPVHFGADPAQIEPSDDLVTQVIPVRSVDAVKLKQDLQPLIGADADLSSNGGSNTIIMTDTAANIRRVVEIVSNLDKRDSLENTIRVKQLKYADASAAAKLITDIFKTDDQNNSGGNSVPPQVQFFRAMRGMGPPGPGGGGGQQDSGEKGRTGRVLASSDQRTNTIVVSGPSDTLKVIDEVLTQLDANPATEQTFFIVSLKNGRAQNMEYVLNNLFGTGGGSGGYRGTSTSGSTNNRTGTSTSGNRSSFGGSSSGLGGSSSAFGSSSGINRTGFGSNGGSTYGGSSSSYGRSTYGGSGTSGLSSSLANAANELMGQVYVVSDVDTNSLLVATATKYQDKVKEIIAQLDRAVPQVLIKVLIAEVSHDNEDDMGLDFSVLNMRKSGRGSKGTTNFGNAALSTGLVVSLIEENITATLHALSTQGKLDVLSRPYILASDNQLASITVGQEVPFITNSRTTDTGQTINTIQYQDIGIILNVTPHINLDGLVILDVSPEISQLTGTTVPISETVSAPVFAKRSADSRVGIRDGQTIVIGGLMEDRKTSTLNKVPLLGDIPLLGSLFQRNDVKKTKTELLIFLTPHVAQQPEALKPMSEDELKGTVLSPGAVEPGTFDAHLRGLQRGGATSQPVEKR